ncbi:MAG: hypothetical protein AB7P14_08695 [Blastocatellales bacterium]
MKEEMETQDTQLRSYLLGNVSPDEEQQIEERLLVDNEYIEQMLIVEEDLIDDYANGQLNPSQQKSYKKRFLATGEGHKKLKISQVLNKHLNTLKQEEESQPTLSEKFRMALANFFSPPVLTALAALLVVGLGGLGWWMFFQTNLSLGVNALKDAYRQERPLEARITGFPYAQFPGASQTSLQVNSARLQAADKAFRELAGKDKSPGSLHAQGKYQLTKKNFDEAIKNLEAGSNAAPDNVALHIDLAVAFLERGKAFLSNSQSEKASADFDASRHHLQDALQLDSSSPEARFNLALLYQTQQLWKEAEEAWRQYLEMDSSSDWAKEATRYLNATIEAQKN